MIKIITGHGSINQFGAELEKYYNNTNITMIEEKLIPTHAGLMWYIKINEEVNK